MRQRFGITAAALVTIGVALVMISSTTGTGSNPLGRAATEGVSITSVAASHHNVPLPAPAVTISLNGTPIINWTGNLSGVLNNTTGHPWGETYDTANGCMYVTEDPVGVGPGYLTWLGPPTGYAPTSQLIPGALNPQGIAWARAYLGEPAYQLAAYKAGIIMIADTGSNSVSVYGIPLVNFFGTVNCQPTFIQTDGVLYNTVTGGLLVNPWDVVFDARSHLFYVTFEMAPGVVAAFSGSNQGCEFFAHLTDPVGLSVDAAGSLEVANFAANGWVTEFLTAGNQFLATCPGNANAKVSSAPGQLDRSVWTTYAPLLLPSSGTTGVKSVVAVSDSNWGIGGNLAGPGVPIAAGCVPGGPVAHETAILKDGTLVCVNSVQLDAAGAPNPGAFGIAYNTKTHHVLEVMSEAGTVEAVDLTAVTSTTTAATGCPISGTCSIEVIWFAPPAATWYAGNTMAVTNWAVGTLFIAPGT
jgi:hypothetical protein